MRGLPELALTAGRAFASKNARMMNVETAAAMLILRRPGSLKSIKLISSTNSETPKNLALQEA
jgi:hypothetical protein